MGKPGHRRVGRRAKAWVPRRSIPILGLLTVLALTACSAAAEPAPQTPSPTAAPAEVDTSTLRTLIDSPVETPTLTIDGDAEPLAGETAQLVSYPSGGLTVGGVLRTPPGADDAPVVVVVHGSVDPARYAPGTDLVAEQRALLESGFVVFALDLRGYAESDAADPQAPVIDPGFGWDTVLDWGMALDVVNGLRLAANGDLPGTDPTRVGLLGHSLGALLSIDAAVIQPGLSELVVAMSVPTTDLTESVAGLTGPGADDTGLPPASDPIWADLSPVTFFDRATEPLLLIHGTADDTAPPAASQSTADAWEAAGGRAEVVLVEGGDHAFAPHRAEAASIVVTAFDSVLGTP